MIRSTLVNLSFRLIATGFRFPDSKNLADFVQWSRLIDLVHRLGVNVFLDVGANRGAFSKHLRLGGYSGRLISFEPIPEDQQRIRALASHDDNWRVCDYALGAESCRRSFNVNFSDDKTVFSSFLPIKQKVGEARTISVEVRRLDDVLPELIAGIASPRIFLKMDTQGFDRQVFDGAVRYAEQIVGIQSEVSVIPLYEGMPHFTESLSHYESFGYRLVDMFVVTRLDDRRVVEYDCVMIRCA